MNQQDLKHSLQVRPLQGISPCLAQSVLGGYPSQLHFMREEAWANGQEVKAEMLVSCLVPALPLLTPYLNLVALVKRELWETSVLN